MGVFDKSIINLKTMQNLVFVFGCTDRWVKKVTKSHEQGTKAFGTKTN